MLPIRNIYRFSRQVDALIEQRRRVNDGLMQAAKQGKDLEIFWHSPQTDILIQLVLYMRHDCPQSQKTLAILNYNQISFNKVDNYLKLKHLRQSKTVSLTEWDYPLLKVNISVDPVQFTSGCDNIIAYLINKELTSQNIPKTTWSDQGLEFVATKIKKPLDLLFLNPVLCWESLFKSSPDGYKKDSNNFLILHYMLIMGYRGIVDCSWSLFELLNNRNDFMRSRENLLAGLKEWVQRLNGQEFHGGQTPDDADFTMFGLLMSRHNSNSFRRFIENKCPPGFYSWFIRMQQRCRYEPDRFFADTSSNSVE